MQPHRRQPTRLLCPWDSLGKNTGMSCHFLLQCRKVKSESEVAQWCLTLCDPMDHNLPGSCQWDFPGESTGVECHCLLQLHSLSMYNTKDQHKLKQTKQLKGFPCASAGKESTCNAGDLGSIPELGRFPGGEKGYPLQYSGLENSMDCIVHGAQRV